MNSLYLKKNYQFLLLIILIAGCTGNSESQMDTETIEIDPILETQFDNEINSFIGEQKLDLVIKSLKADSKGINIEFSASDGIVLKENSIYIEQIPNETNKNIEVFYDVSKAGEDEISFTISGENVNGTNGTITVISRVDVPKFEIGEFWVYNQTLNGKSDLVSMEVLKIEDVDDIPAYVIKNTHGGDIKGNYELDYFSVKDSGSIKKEYYVQDEYQKEISYVPILTSLPFPFQVRDTWDYSGTATGIGKIDINGVIQNLEKRKSSAGEFDTYKYKYIMALPVGTVDSYGYYSPEIKREVYQKATSTLGTETLVEIELDLVEHGLPPKKAPEIQVEIEVPEGYELYRNEELGFLMAHPANWKVNVEPSDNENIYVVLFSSKTQSIYVTVFKGDLLSLEEWKDNLIEYYKKKYIPISFGPEKCNVNGFECYNWIYGSSREKGDQYVFLNDDTGYLIGFDSKKKDYESLNEIFNNSMKTFFILESPSLYSLN